jgi:hypothetical protein
MIGPFLIKLVERSEVLGHYLRDPVGAMEAEGLSDAEQEILLSGNLRRLREALQAEYPDRKVFIGNVPQVGNVPMVTGNVPQVQPPDDPDSSES